MAFLASPLFSEIFSDGILSEGEIILKPVRWLYFRQSFVFELTGSPDKIDSFIALMRELGLVEVGRSGIVGMMRGTSAE